MGKVILGSRPKTFKPIPVTFAMPDGSEGTIKCVFKYRTRKEFADFIDAVVNAGKSPTPKTASGGNKGKGKAATPEVPAVEPAAFSMAGVVDTSNRQMANQLLESLDSWDMDAEITEEALIQLIDEIPVSAQAILGAYRNAAMDGYLGN